MQVPKAFKFGWEKSDKIEVPAQVQIDRSIFENLSNFQKVHKGGSFNGLHPVYWQRLHTTLP